MGAASWWGLHGSLCMYSMGQTDREVGSKGSTARGTTLALCLGRVSWSAQQINPPLMCTAGRIGNVVFMPPPPPLQEDEEDYHRQFPDQFAAFADLAPDEQPDTLAGASEADATAAAAAAAAAAAGQQPEGEAAGAAALSARDLVLGGVLQELVAVHATCFGSGPAASEVAAGTSGTGCGDQFLRSYELGTQLLRAVGLVAPAALDAATSSGHLYATACRFRQLAAPALSASAAAAAGVDIQAACVEEAVLVQAPVLALRARLRQLLEEWPDHPGLLQVGTWAECYGGTSVFGRGTVAH